MTDSVQDKGRMRPGNREETGADLYSAVYQELRTIAHARLSAHHRTPDLTTTALVHEAYLKLSGTDGEIDQFTDRGHFYSTAALAMRQIITDMARKRCAKKRGGKFRDMTLEEVHLASDDRVDELVAIDDALRQLERWNPRLGQVVNLKFFAGLGLNEIAEVQQQSRRNVTRDWQKARAFLRALMAV